MVPDNALLIRTGGTAPDRLRKPIERILRGTGASVQMTDVVAREGLDPDVVQTAVVVGSVADAVGVYRYRVLGGGQIAPDPSWVASHIATETVPILGNVTCNKLIFPQLRGGAARRSSPAAWPTRSTPVSTPAATTRASSPGPPSSPTTRSGWPSTSTCPATSAAPSARSTAGSSPIFKSWGFAWGGDWGYTDPMHFEMNAAGRAPLTVASLAHARRPGHSKQPVPPTSSSATSPSPRPAPTTSSSRCTRSASRSRTCC